MLVDQELEGWDQARPVGSKHVSLEDGWVNVAFFRLNAVISLVFLAAVLAEVVFEGGFRLR